jgi:hypothetical protein
MPLSKRNNRTARRDNRKSRRNNRKNRSTMKKRRGGQIIAFNNRAEPVYYV